MDKIAELLKSISNNCKKLDKDCNNILENNNRVLSNNKNIDTIQVTNILRLTLAAIYDSNEIGEEVKEMIKKAIPNIFDWNFGEFIENFIEELNHENGGNLTQEQMMARIIFYSSVFNSLGNIKNTNPTELDFIINLMEKNKCDYWVDGNEIGFYNNTEYTIFTEDINEIKKINDAKYIIREQEEYMLIDFKNQKIDWIE